VDEISRAASKPIIRRLSIIFSSSSPERTFDLSDSLGHTRGEHLVPQLGYEHVVFNADADSSIARIYALSIIGDIEARLDGHHHSWLQPAPFIGYLVRPGIVNVHPKPVTGPVHVKLPERVLCDQCVNLAFK